MSIFSSAGTRFLIESDGARPAREDYYSYAGLNYTDIGCLLSLSPYGEETEGVSFKDIKTRRMKTVGGIRNSGTIEISIGMDEDQAAYPIIYSLYQNNFITDRIFKVALDTRVFDGSPERYFSGKILSVKEMSGEANSVVSLNLTIAINSAYSRYSRSFTAIFTELEYLVNVVLPETLY